MPVPSDYDAIEKLLDGRSIPPHLRQKKNVSYLTKETIAMLQQLFHKKILKERFDTLIENSKFSNEILRVWIATKGKTIADFDAIIAKINQPKPKEKKEDSVRRQPFVLWHDTADKLPEVIFHSGITKKLG